jgi:hypothetical protein
MQKTYVFGTMLALALTGSVYAQQDQSAASSAQKDREVTVTGCLVPGAPSAATTAGTAGTAGSTSSTSGASKFMLANASITSGPGATASTGTTGTSGTSGAAGTSAAAGASYHLIGGDSSDLDKNLNSKVEIRGVIEPASSASAAGGTMTGGTSGATGAAAAKQLRVTSVRQLASTCGGGQ